MEMMVAVGCSGKDCWGGAAGSPSSSKPSLMGAVLSADGKSGQGRLALAHLKVKRKANLCD